MRINKKLLIIAISFLCSFIYVGISGTSESFYAFGNLVTNSIFIFFYQGIFYGFFLSAFVIGIMTIIESYKKVDKSVKLIMIIAAPVLLLGALWIGFIIFIPTIIKEIKLEIKSFKMKRQKDPDVIEIKPTYLNLMAVIIIVIVQAACYILGRKNGMFAMLYMVLLYWGVMLVLDIYLLADGILLCRSIVMDQEGCTLRLFNISRTYKWDELAVKRLEYGYRNLNGSIPMGGVFFSVRPVEKEVQKDPRRFCLFKNPFSCFFVYLNVGKVYSLHYRMCAERKMFFKKISQWGVQLTVD